jgi:GTP-binding protein HflX
MSRETVSTERRKERAFLITVDVKGDGERSVEERQTELKRLASACGLEIAGGDVCTRKSISPGLFIGTGKAEEFRYLMEEDGADVAVFNNDLSPSQQQNLEDVLGVKTIDRTQLILDIFAERASTKESKIQVELAQLLYLLPRLSGKGIQLSRLGGGVGTRGPGEQKLEVDRRRIRSRIGRLKKELEQIRNKRDVMRSRRKRSSVRNVALVGYTNSGKSTLFNKLTGAGITAKDQLFSTLDATVRKVVLPGKQSLLVSDTVGFISDLPHHLVESFMTTLEEVTRSDVLFHVVDVSHSRVRERKRSVYEVLSSLGAMDKPIITVLNKTDLLDNPQILKRYMKEFPTPVPVSALTGDGVGELKENMLDMLNADMSYIDITIPHAYFAAADIIMNKGLVVEKDFTEKGIRIKARLPEKVKQAVFKVLREMSGDKEGLT